MITSKEQKSMTNVLQNCYMFIFCLRFVLILNIIQEIYQIYVSRFTNSIISTYSNYIDVIIYENLTNVYYLIKVLVNLCFFKINFIKKT